MDIKFAESLVAEASDALARNQHPEAVEFYNHLWSAYQRFPLFEDAQISICFNHFCAALMLADEQERLKSAQRLLTAFQEEPEAKALTCEVATRLYRLLSGSPDVLPQSMQALLMEACAPYAYELLGHLEPQLVLEDSPPPHHLTLIQPSDAGLLSYLMAAHTSDVEELEPWLRTIYRRHQLSLKIDPYVEEVFAYLRDELERPEPNLVNTYISLLSAFEWAVYSAPALAFEWLVGLLKWERIKKVNDQLTVQINRPMERRTLLTIYLHKRHALDLMNESEGVRLALHHWQEVINLSEFLLSSYEQRELERGQRNLGDVEAAARVSLDLAHAYLVHGDHVQAFSALSTAVRDADREAFTELTVAPQVFKMQGTILERMGALEEAFTAYERAAKLSKLSFFVVDPYEYPVDVLASELANGLSPALAEVGAYAVADYYRTWALLALQETPELDSLEPWRTRVLWVHTLMIGARGNLPYETFVQVMLYLELTLCMLEDPHAPQRALTYARSLKHTDAITLCELYLLRQSFYELEREPVALLPRAISEYRRVFDEARSGGKGSVIRRVAMDLVSLHCRLLELPDLERSEEIERLIDDLDMEVELFAPVIARDPLNQRVGRYDIFLPPDGFSEPKRAIEALVADGRWEAVRRISWALKHLNHQNIYTPHRRDFSELIHKTHQERFDYVWMEGGQTLPEHIDPYLVLLQKNDSDERPKVMLQVREGRLEYKVFDDQILVTFIYSIEDGKSIVTGTTIPISRRACRDYVKRFKALFCQESYDAEANRALLEVCGDLYALLIEPFQAEISRLHRLMISADHPLHEVPFCALYAPDGRFLVQQVEVLMTEVCSDTNIPTVAKQSNDCLVIGAEAQTAPVLRVLSPLQENNRFASVRSLPTASFKAAYKQDQAPAQVICLRGDIQNEAFIMKGEGEGSWTFTMRDLSQSISAFQPACVVIADPISRRRAQPLIRTALSASHTAVIAIHRPTSLMQQWLRVFFNAATTPYRPFSYSASLTNLRRRAIQNTVSPFDWAAFEMYVTDETPWA